MKDIIINKDKTRYANNEKLSLTDHISTNLINQIDNISTDRQAISDHCMVPYNLHADKQVKTEKFLFTQDWTKVNKNWIDCSAELEPDLTEMWFEPNIHAMWKSS